VRGAASRDSGRLFYYLKAEGVDLCPLVYLQWEDQTETASLGIFFRVDVGLLWPRRIGACVIAVGGAWGDY